MPANIPPNPPVDQTAEIIQSSTEKPFPNSLQARRERDGSWVVKVITKDGVANTLVIPPGCK